MTYECLECGEPATHSHPEYSCGDYGDHLCDGCFGGYIEEQLDTWVEELRNLVATTDYQPNDTVWYIINDEDS